MKFKIGFSAEKEDNKVVILENNQSDCIDNALEKNEDIRKSVVEVFFPDKGTSYPYYNDMFNLK